MVSGSGSLGSLVSQTAAWATMNGVLCFTSTSMIAFAHIMPRQQTPDTLRPGMVALLLQTVTTKMRRSACNDSIVQCTPRVATSVTLVGNGSEYLHFNAFPPMTEKYAAPSKFSPD